MWMVDPEIMCRKHLLGEHVEIHMFIGSIKRSIKMAGYLNNGLLEPGSLYARHDILVEEMLNRGMNHKSPLPGPAVDIVNAFTVEEYIKKVDSKKSLKNLLRRCPECRSKFRYKYGKNELWELRL